MVIDTEKLKFVESNCNRITNMGDQDVIRTICEIIEGRFGNGTDLFNKLLAEAYIRGIAKSQIIKYWNDSRIK